MGEGQLPLITVCCVLRSGGDYTPEYVQRLQEGVSAHLSGHRFVCLSDVDVHCERIPLVTDWPGWFSKLEIFRLAGKVLYFDLDTVITGDLTEIANYPHKFTMLEDFYYPKIKGSGVMAWDGDFRYIYDNFSMDLAPQYARMPRLGDGGYIQEQVIAQTFQALLPGQIMSRKVHSKRREARVVCYHGQPRPKETGWAA